MTRLTRRFDEALVYAREAHQGQVRKGTNIPYFAHLMGVAAIAIEAGASEDQAIAALLHDAVEDQGGADRLADIRARFGEEVARIVDDCSDSEGDPKPPWKERKLAYLASLRKKPETSLLVSLADKIHNAEAILCDLECHGDVVFDRFTGRKDGTLWYYDALATAFAERMPGAWSSRLSRVVAAMREASGTTAAA